MVEYNVNLESKTVLVTGAAGFIGSNLVKRLFHDVKNIKVIGIDSEPQRLKIPSKTQYFTSICKIKKIYLVPLSYRIFSPGRLN